MNRYSCRAHNQPSKANCPQCKPLTSTAPLSDKELLAQRLAVFLGVNDVETYVSEKGYRFKKITISPRFAHGEAPWNLPSSKENVA